MALVAAAATPCHEVGISLGGNKLNERVQRSYQYFKGMVRCLLIAQWGLGTPLTDLGCHEFKSRDPTRVLPVQYKPTLVLSAHNKESD